MESSLNIITDDLDYIDGHFFYANRRWSGDEKIDLFLKEILDFHGVNSIKRTTLDDAINDESEIYYYFITCLRSLHSVFEKYGTLPIHDKLLSTLLNKNNIKIVFYNNNEPDDEKSFNSLNDYVRNKKLSPNLFYFVNNNAILEEIKRNNFSKINVYSSRDLINKFSKKYSLVLTPFITDKKYLFSCYNGHSKIHRYAILSLLKYTKVLGDCDWSLLYGSDYKKHHLRRDGFTPNYNSYSNIFDRNNIVDLKNEIDYFSSIDKKVSEFETNIDVDDPREYTGTDLYTQSYINVVTESMFTEKGVVHITEKTIRPFQFYQIPIFVATPNHVKKIKDRYKLDLFDDIINHSYDLDQDDNSRLFSVSREIVRLSNDKNHIIDFYKKNKHRFEYNRRIINEISNENSDRLFFVSMFKEKPKNEYINIVCDNLNSNNEMRCDCENIRCFCDDFRISNYRFFNIDEVSKYPNEKFFIFIEHGMWFSYIVENENINILKGDFLKKIIKNKNLYIVLINQYEADSPFFINYLDDFCKKINVSTDRFIAINNNENIHKLKKDLNIDILFNTTDKLIRLCATKFSRISNHFHLDREFIFMTHNRIIKSHRLCLLVALKHHNILEKTNWSFLMGSQLKNPNENTFNLIFNDDDFNFYSNSIEYIRNVGDIKSKYEERINCKNPFDCIEDLETYNHSYINLVTETFFTEKDSIHITEKSFIPFYFYQVPIFFSTYGHVDAIRHKYGFDLFDDLVDHSYDNEIDNNKRFHLIMKEVIRLSNMENEIREYFIKNKHRFDFNKNKFTNLKSIDKIYQFLVNLPNNVK